MLNHKSNTPQHAIQPIGPIRRSFPGLQLEIGESAADLLLQLDHWIAYEGKKGWILMSAPTIQKRAFTTWSTRKISRTILRLAQSGYILLACQIWPVRDRTPLIALNYQVLKTLVSVQITGSDKMTDGQTKRQDGQTECRKGQTKRQDLDLYIYKSQNTKNPNGLKEGGKEGKDKKEKNPPPSESFILALANICLLDFDLNRKPVAQTAQDLNDAGYTDPEDLFDLKAWWYKHDWRGQKDSPPFLSQIQQVIKQALDHKDTQERKTARKNGFDPDNSSHTYISGADSDIINY